MNDRKDNNIPECLYPGVTVRLNVDEENLGEIFRVVDFLKNEFSEEEKMRLQVYAHSLFAQQGEGLDACPADAGSDALEERVLEINDYIHRQGLMPFDPGDLFTFKSHYCMVTAPECNVLIDAEETCTPVMPCPKTCIMAM